MKQYLKTYDLILKTKGPVFVGSGRNIEKKEYVFLNKSKIGIPNIAGLYQLIKSKGKVKDFEAFFLQNNKDDLSNWLRKNNITTKEIEKYITYELDCGDAVIEKNRRPQIMEAIKDPYGCPYIPGSSIKGMFRTVFLCADILQRPEKYRKQKEAITSLVCARTDGRGNRNTFLQKEILGTEAIAYRTMNRPDTKPGDAVNDYMQGFVVSDSEPLSVDDLYLCQKVDMHTSGEEKKLPILRECIKPGTEIRFTITVDHSICPLKERDILNAIEHFNEVYNKHFAGAFPHIDRIAANDILIGGGSGFVSKTVIYALFDKIEGINVTKEIFKKTKVPREHKHEKDREYGAAPHVYKCARYKGKLVSMGVCELRLSEKR